MCRRNSLACPHCLSFRFQSLICNATRMRFKPCVDEMGWDQGWGGRRPRRAPLQAPAPRRAAAPVCPGPTSCEERPAGSGEGRTKRGAATGCPNQGRGSGIQKETGLCGAPRPRGGAGRGRRVSTHGSGVPGARALYDKAAAIGAKREEGLAEGQWCRQCAGTRRFLNGCSEPARPGGDRSPHRSATAAAQNSLFVRVAEGLLAYTKS